MPLVHVKDVSLAFGAKPLLDHIELVIDSGERIGLIGRNGEGKSSLLKILAHETAAESGTIARQQGLTWAYARQEPEHAAEETAFNIIAHGIVGFDAATQSYEVDAALTDISIAPDARFGSLSGGQQKRVQLAAAAVGKPDLLLLDEPTNHLDLDGIAELEERLLRFRGGMVIVSHDRSFLDRVCTRMVEIDRGKLSVFFGNFAYYRVKKAEQLEREAASNARADKLLAQEEVWIRRGIEARRTRDMGRVRRLEALRAERSARRDRIGNVKFRADVGAKTGKVVCELIDATFARGERTIVPPFSTVVSRGDKIGIIGPNGIGKTTLVKLLVDELKPTGGRIHRPAYTDNVTRVAYLDQSREWLKEEDILADVISPGSDYVEIAGARRHVISYLEDFLFPADRARAKVSSLSGGERARLLLARLFARPANVLVLDEPTNDLDVETIELLEEMLQDYQGTVLLVSHDRALLNNVATQSFAFDADGVLREYPGGYDDWVSQRPALSKIQPALPDAAESLAARPPAAVRERKPRMSFNETRELEQLPDKIAALEAEQHEIEAKLADPKFFAANALEATRISTRHAELLHELEAAYARWTELEDKRVTLTST